MTEQPEFEGTSFSDHSIIHLLCIGSAKAAAIAHLPLGFFSTFTFNSFAVPHQQWTSATSRGKDTMQKAWQGPWHLNLVAGLRLLPVPCLPGCGGIWMASN